MRAKATKFNSRGDATEWILDGITVRKTKRGEISEAYTKERYCTVDGKWMGRSIKDVVRVAKNCN